MGEGFRQLFHPFKPPAVNRRQEEPPDVVVNTSSKPLDEPPVSPAIVYTPTKRLNEPLGYSFCYVPPSSSSRFVSPGKPSCFFSPFQSLRFCSLPPARKSNETVFRAISGAAISANCTISYTLSDDDDDKKPDEEVDANESSNGSHRKNTLINGFDCSSSFRVLPLQPVPPIEGDGQDSAQLDRSGTTFILSGPIEKGLLLGPLDCTGESNRIHAVPFSSPLCGIHAKKRPKSGGASTHLELSKQNSVQWALGKAGEDRVHVVVSEEHEWLFVGIYDGFSGSYPPDFLMSNLFKALYKELEGLFWDNGDTETTEILDGIGNIGLQNSNHVVEGRLVENRELQLKEGGTGEVKEVQLVDGLKGISEIEEETNESCVEDPNKGSAKKVAFQSREVESRRKRFSELLSEEGSNRLASSVNDPIDASNARSGVSRSSKLKHSLFPWKFGLTNKEKETVEAESRAKVGRVNPKLVLEAMSRALEVTEVAYSEMVNKVLDRYPDLAVMGSCLLVVLIKDEDVYVMNLGDSRAILAQYNPEGTSMTEANARVESVESVSNTGISVESAFTGANKSPIPNTKFKALQLSTDHTTNVEEEVLRIKNEHPDDSKCIIRRRVKGHVTVTRAFGAGYLKQPKMSDVLLPILRINFIGDAPYISCTPSLCHHRLCLLRDQFLVLSSDGLYQFFTNQEIVSFVETFMEKFPDGDPAQHLIEKVLVRAARRQGMDFHQLLKVPQGIGDRRKLHDDVTVIVISLKGRIWKSSGKCT